MTELSFYCYSSENPDPIEKSVLCGLMVIGESKGFGKRRRIPFDSQRTSLAGLALESNNHKSPRSAMLQAPPGTKTYYTPAETEY
ncbi:hypothetical protein TNCV_1395371 [Trichonephila clavipes]|nr:hypothetical protein TNCV_1395371 [Trichonephila clavipes]